MIAIHANVKAQSVSMVISGGGCPDAAYDFQFNSCSGCIFTGWNITGSHTVESSSSGVITMHWDVPGTFQVRANYSRYGSNLTTSPVAVTINSVPVPVISGPTASSPGSTVTYSSTTMSAYSWSVSGGTLISGQGTNAITVTWPSTGTKYVSVSGHNGFCPGSSSIVVTVSSVPIPDVQSATGITSSSFTANWNGVAGATSYRLDVSTDSLFSSFMSGYNARVVSGTSHQLTGLPDNATYYYRVRAVTSAGTSNNSAKQSVRTDPASAYTYVSNVGTSSFTFGYGMVQVPGVWTYHLQVSLTANFSTILHEYSTVAISGQWNVQGLSQNTTYYLRSRIKFTNGTWSSFEVRDPVTTFQMPPAPVVQSPASSITETSFTAVWSVVPAAVYYFLDIAYDESFTQYVDNYQNLLITGTVCCGGNSRSYQATGLMAGKTYHYRLRAVNSNGVASVNSNTVSASTHWPSVNNQTKNMIISRTALKELDDPDIITNPVPGNVQINIGYFDGLGRPLQHVDWQASPSGHDIVTPVSYDPFGRETVKYLPYVSGNDGFFKTDFLPKQHASYSTNANAQYQFYQATPGVAADAAPYSETILEPSPLNRVIKQGAPGTEWMPDGTHTYQSTDHTIKFDYTSNATNEVLLWTFAPPDASNPFGRVNSGTNGAYYAPNELYKNKTKDEQGHEVIEYKDKEGKVILKKAQADGTGTYAQTYYIYDNFSQLVCVIPPEATKLITKSPSDYFGKTDAAKNTFLNTWAFRYTYDGRRRIAMKQVPGAGAVYMVYDKRDRLVLTQDANQRSGSNKYWSFTKYDALNRPVLTGIKDTSVLLTQAQMQSAVDAHYAKSWAKYGEIYVSNAANNVHGYSNKSYPVLTGPVTANDANRYLTVTYYDSYDFKSLWTGSYNYVDENLSQTANGVTYNQPDAEFTSMKGQVTGTKIKALDGGVAGGYTWLKSITYYDERYRPVQVIADNYKGGTDRVTSLYDFTGKMLKTKSTHTQADLVWKDLVSAATIGNRLVSVGSPVGWGGSGAASVQQLGSGQDGWVEFTASAVGYNWMLGLSDQNTDANFTSLDYAWYLGTSSLTIRESGAARSFSGTYLPGDVLRIERTSTTIKYYQNGILRYTSAVPSSTALMVDVAMEANSNIVGVRSSFSATSQITTRRFDYDHAGRLINTWHQLDSGPEILLVKNQYNELGQLIDKKLHSEDGNTFKQSIDHTYNIRGWLTNINESDLNVADEDATRDLFGMQLLYNESDGISNTQLYNGNISGIKWSNNQALGDIKQNAYVYDYDPMNRIMSSAYKEKMSAWTAATNSGNAETGFTYDLNGNIKTLQRNDRRGSGWMDNLTYDYGSGTAASNKLLKVTDAGDIAKGFIDGNTSGSDYAYDANGNLTTDKNKGISGSSGNVISYNYLNLPEKVQKSATQVVRYIYDAAGRKLRQELTDGANRKATDYSGEYIYENDTLQFINHEEGRIILESPAPVPGSHPFEYQYHLKDHLGNVRLTFTSKHEIDTALATMETANIADEQSDFLYYDEAVKINSTIFDHTNNGVTNYALRLTGMPNHQYGLAKSLSVMPGDTVKVTVYAKYLESDTTEWNPGGFTTFMNAVRWGSPGTGVLVDGGLTGSTGGVTPPNGYVVGKGDGNEDGAPKAYVNFLVFDRDYNLITGGYEPITEAAREYGQDGAHEELFKELAITEPGYVYLYLSNDNVALGGSAIEVFFDDFTVEHIKSPIVQQDDYYAFGLTFNSYQRENSLKNRYNYIGKEEQDWGALDFGFRMYESVIGRWNSVDPLAENSISMTPYHYAGDSPIAFFDPNGLDWFYYKNEGDEEAGWHWQDGNEYKHTYSYKDDDGNDVTSSITLQGVEAAIVFDATDGENLGEGSSLSGDGAKLAKVTVYGPGGKDDVKNYEGYTKSADPDKWGTVASNSTDWLSDNAYYKGKNWKKSKGLPSSWLLGENFTVPAEGGVNPSNGTAVVRGAFIHTTGSSGKMYWTQKFYKDILQDNFAEWGPRYVNVYSHSKERGTSEGCLIIAYKDWENFVEQMGGYNNKLRFAVQVLR